jgi:tetratricopeptide (TPR) repeat protein
MINYIIIFIGIVIIIIFFIILKSTSFPARIKKAEELLEQGDVSKAFEIVKAILDKKRDYVPARYLRALILIRQNQYLLAITELNSLLSLPELNTFVNEIDIHYHLARLYHETQNFRKEIDEYKEILIFNPEDLIANHRIGHALYKKKDFKRAREHLLKAVIIDPNLTDIFLPLGVSCYYVSDYEKSEEYLIHALKAPGDNSEAQYYLGSIYQMKKDYKSAVSMFQNARVNRKYFLKCLEHIGEIYFQLEEFDSAIEILEEGLPSLKEKNEESLEYRYLLAECYERQNKIKEAIHHWQKIADENPGFRGTKMKLESYREILDNENLIAMFASSLEALQPTIVEMISSLNYTILSKEKLDQNEYQYKAYNIKRIGDPPILICFNRTTREITENTINEFHKRIIDEKCKNGIYIATARFSLRAKTTAQSKMIEIYDSDYIQKIMEKIKSRKKMK